MLTQWTDDAANVAWTRAAGAELAERGCIAPWPNFVADDDRRRLRVPYAAATLARLRAVKRTWDPSNVVRAGHAIPPA